MEHSDSFRGNRQNSRVYLRSRLKRINCTRIFQEIRKNVRVRMWQKSYSLTIWAPGPKRNPFQPKRAALTWRRPDQVTQPNGPAQSTPNLRPSTTSHLCASEPDVPASIELKNNPRARCAPRPKAPNACRTHPLRPPVRLRPKPRAPKLPTHTGRAPRPQRRVTSPPGTGRARVCRVPRRLMPPIHCTTRHALRPRPSFLRAPRLIARGRASEGGVALV